ncbi:MAG: NifU N-terminal domain-containing protein [Chloroflexota bacterium]
MSEYITINVESNDDPDCIRLITNLMLTDDDSEVYPDRETGDEGSPLAQTLFEIEGLVALEIEDNILIVRRDPDAEWHVLIDEITEALKDFFL